MAAPEQQSIPHTDKQVQLVMEKIVIQTRVTFLDYIFGGCEISLQVAVDFTASNGEISNPNSLHFMGGHQPN